MTNTRSPEEIIHRFAHMAPSEDILGVQREDLLLSLPLEDVRPYLRDGVEEWVPADPMTRIREYMPFAIRKALGHRSISAQRSVDHMRTWVWLLGDEAYEAIDWDDFPQYGVPILRAIAAEHGVDWPNDEMLRRMSQGNPCEEDCYEGCER